MTAKRVKHKNKVYFQKKAWVNTIRSDIDVDLTVSPLYILLIHLQFFVFDTEIGFANPLFFLIQKIHLHVSFPWSDAAGLASFP